MKRAKIHTIPKKNVRSKIAKRKNAHYGKRTVKQSVGLFYREHGALMSKLAHE